MLRGCYTFKELKEKYNWESNASQIDKQIQFARKRGILIEKAFKEGPSYFRIVEDTSDFGGEWKTCPSHPYFEANKKGLLRTAQDKKIVGFLDEKTGYMRVFDPEKNKNLAVHRLIMETFNPIENSDMYVVDHINGKRDDNRIENLRWLTQRQNTNAKDENYARLNENYQKLIQRYGYDRLNQLFESILNTLC